MNEKIIGYVLLILGVGMILFSVFDVYRVFTKAKKPVSFFSFPAISLDISSIINQKTQQSLSNLNLPDMIDLSAIMKPNTKSDQGIQQEIISSEMVNDPMNLFAHVFLMGFIATGGLKIATIGTYLLRTITVKVKETDQKTL